MFVVQNTSGTFANHTNEEWQYGNQCNDTQKINDKTSTASVIKVKCG